jgi:hypothetical protein
MIRDRSLITGEGEGEGGLVENEGGQIFLCMKKVGGAKNFVQYKYLPHMTPPYHKTYR